MEKIANYHADIQVAEGTYLVTFPDIPEAITEGSTMQEALANAEEVLGQALRALFLARGKPLPKAEYKGGTEIVLDTWDTLKIGLIEAFSASGLTQKELAARTGRAQQEIQRVLNPLYGSKVQALEQALAALGKRPLVIFADIPAAA